MVCALMSVQWTNTGATKVVQQQEVLRKDTHNAAHTALVLLQLVLNLNLSTHTRPAAAGVREKTCMHRL